jgi:hypothetical protein
MTSVLVSTHAATFVNAHGGTLFVWVNPKGLQHTALDRPDTRRFDEIEGAPIRFYVDPQIAEALLWKVEYAHLPRPHVAVYWNATIPSGPAGTDFTFWATLLRTDR